MIGPLAVALPLVLASVLIVSAAVKLRAPDNLEGWALLGVPEFLRRPWLVRLHPWGELLVGTGLVLLGGLPGLLMGFLALGLFGAYLIVVAHASRTIPDAACACFGARKKITRATIVRNGWLTLLSFATVAVIWTNPSWGGALAAGVADAGWIVALAVSATTVGVILWPTADDLPSSVEPAVRAAEADIDGELLDYERVRTPGVTVRLADGQDVNIRELAARKPILLLAVSEWCQSCQPVHARAESWQQLLPEVDVRLLLQFEPEDATWTRHAEPQSLHDPAGHFRASLAEWSTPSAVLLGADGWLAGGPIEGTNAITAFVGDIYESLHGSRPTVERLVGTPGRAMRS